MPTFKSGAFVQQCFAAHPLSLSLKALPAPDRVVVACANCHMRHRMAVRTLMARTGNTGEPITAAADDLARCAAAHPAELRVSAVDVVRDSVKLHCDECRRTYLIDVSSFETYRKEG
jgi:hypothetical protein